MKRLFQRSLLLIMLLMFSAAGVSAYEYAWFPAPSLDVWQLPYESASHGSCNALDYSPHGRVFAPFTGVVKQIDPEWGFVLFQSKNKVYYADGTLAYMTVGFLHDENVSDLHVGQVIRQGEKFYDAGGQGYGYSGAYDRHVDMSILKGRINSVTRYGRGDTYAFNAMYINPNKTKSILRRGKLSPGNVMYNNAPSNWSKRWKTLPANTVAPAPAIAEKVPSGTTISSLKNNLPSAFSLVWKRNSGVRGYDVMIASNSTFTSGKTVCEIRKNSITELVAKGKKGKTYYIKIRTVSASGLTSGWSAVKKVTITR